MCVGMYNVNNHFPSVGGKQMTFITASFTCFFSVALCVYVFLNENDA